MPTDDAYTTVAGKRVSQWRVVTWTVSGGYQLQVCRWVDDGATADQEHHVWRPGLGTIYLTRELAQGALDELERIP